LVIREYDVSDGKKLLNEGAPFICCGVNNGPLLTPIPHVESWNAPGFVALRRFNFNNFSALFSQQHPCIRTGNTLREFDDLYPCK